MIAHYYVLPILLTVASWSLSFLTLYVLLSFFIFLIILTLVGKLSITALLFTFDFLTPLNANVILVVAYLLLLFAFAPSFTFFLKLYSFSFLTSSSIGSHSLSFPLLLTLLIYFAFLFNGFILRNFLFTMALLYMYIVRNC